jgi:hypothetical protein
LNSKCYKQYLIMLKLTFLRVLTIECIHKIAKKFNIFRLHLFSNYTCFLFIYLHILCKELLLLIIWLAFRINPYFEIISLSSMFIPLYFTSICLPPWWVWRLRLEICSDIWGTNTQGPSFWSVVLIISAETPESSLTTRIWTFCSLLPFTCFHWKSKNTNCFLDYFLPKWCTNYYLHL